MSKLLITQYLNELARLRQVGGTQRESVVSEAFKDLLKGYARSHDLVFIPQYQFKTAAKDLRTVDGALLHALRMPFGYWEAKDDKDDLDAEIETKFKRGYPKDNIIFEDSTQAVLIQNGSEVIRCKVDDTDTLQKLLGLFFAYERREISEFRQAVKQFTTDLPAVLEALRAMIERAYTDNASFRTASEKFLDHARKTINPSLVEADVREILIQHILTDEIFDTVFPGEVFHKDNNVARELHKLEDTFFTGNTRHQTLKSLEVYYRAIRGAASQIDSHHEKQTFLKVVYENFYKVYNPKAADRLGVVYTPNEIVRFMIESADWLCEQHFGRSLIDRDVEILDPATGTGTFITELIEHFRGQPAKLKHKYREELHANEVALLPYYVANLNIEATYAAITGEYEEFPGLCLVDTLDNVAGLGKKTGDQIADLFGMGDENVERIRRQNKRKISVIIGNPPYNANQANENDNNKNREYPEIDRRIKDSYIKASTAQKTKLYDMYARFFRWASDRLHDDGILAFITNRSFLDARTFDGFRKVVAQEFAEIRVVDLGGDVRANPKLSGTKHNVFGIQTGVAISFLVKKRGSKACRIFYTRRPEMETAEEKLAWVARARMRDEKADEIRPDAKQHWLNLTNNDFDTLLPSVPESTKGKSVFRLISNGIVTARDEWMVDSNQDHLHAKAAYFISSFEAERKRWHASPESKIAKSKERKSALSNFVSREIKWTSELETHLDRATPMLFDESNVRRSVYRPFVTRPTYYAKVVVHRTYRQNQIFPIGTPWENLAIGFSGLSSSKPFQTLVVDRVPSYDLLEKTQFLPLKKLNAAREWEDNITDWALKQFKSHYKVEPSAKPSPETKKAKPQKALAISKQAIFHYVYAVLHDPLYREKYAQNLKREFPRIPLYGSAPADFWRWAEWGEQLMALHIGFESVEPWPLARIDIADDKARAAEQSPKAMLKADRDNGRLLLDSETTLTGVPPEAWTYRLGNRSALEWVLDQHKESKPKDPTIRERFNTYRFADHKERVIDLLSRVTRVSVDTQAIVEAMRASKRD